MYTFTMALEVKAVAFDLDGTLYPNCRLYVRLLPFIFKHGHLLSAFGKARDQIRREQEESPASVRQNFYDYQALLTARKLNKPAEKIREQIENQIYRGWEPYFLKIKLFPYVKELLLKLRETGYKTGLLSDFPPENKLKNLGIRDCFNTVLCSENTGAIKPAIQPFLSLAENLGCRPEEVLYTGNSYNYDIIGARRAGMKTALLVKRIQYKKASFTQKKGNAADFLFCDYRQFCNFVL